MKKLISLVLAVLTVLSLAVPAMATEQKASGQFEIPFDELVFVSSGVKSVSVAPISYQVGQTPPMPEITVYYKDGTTGPVPENVRIFLSDAWPTEPGRYTLYISVANKYSAPIEVTVLAEGGTEHVHSYATAVTAPTCTDEGYTTYTCACGDTYKGNTVAALGHALGEWETVQAPTCTEAGLQKKSCSRCPYSETSEIAVTGHTYTSKVTAPTCTEEGYTVYTCACGHSYKDAIVPATGHTYTETVVKPTFTEKGYTQFDCACGHSYKGNITDVLTLAVPAVKVTYDAATGKQTLTWTDGGDGISYEVYRATSKSGKYTKVATVSGGAYQDADASVGKTYYYKVRAVYEADTSAVSDYSAVVSAAAKCAVVELTVQTGSTGKPVLSWAKITGAKKYEIWRSVDGAAFKKLTTVTKLTYTDTKATDGTACTYKVKAVASKSTYNGEFSQTGSCYVTCAVPALTLKVDTATGKPSLSWKKITGANGYEVCRTQAGSTQVMKVTVTQLTYVDTTAVAGTTYTYTVKALGKSEAFNSAESKAIDAKATCAQPKLTGVVNDNGKPVISWAAVESAVSYKIFRSTSSSKNYKEIATVTDLSYVDTTVAAGKTFYYKVVAVGAGCESAQSSYLKMTGKCDIPTLSVEAGATGKPVLTWNKIDGAKKYEIWRSVDGAAFKKLTTTTKVTYTDTKATDGTKCVYKVKALASSSKNNGLFSAELGCNVLCATPVVTAKADTATGKPVISWKKVTGATGYAIYRAKDWGNFEYVTTITGTSYTDANISADVHCSYKVVALGKAEVFNSAESAVVEVRATCAQPKVKGEISAETGKPVLTWEADTGAIYYRVYRSTSSSKNFKEIGTSETTTFEDTGAAKNKTYYYKVTAVSSHAESALSSYAKLKAKK